MKKVLISLLVAGILVGIIVFLNSKITTFEECEKSGLLVRAIRIYDGDGSIEKECFLWIGRSFVKQKISADESNLQTSTQQKWETKTDEQLPVTVKVTPLEFGKDTKKWKFDIAFDTHSGSLDDDPLAIATLVDDKSNVFQPNNWEGAGSGGHHREGVLVFDAINPMPLFVELKIKGVGGVSERSFRWNIK